jgi:hypothetical protein
MLKKLLFFKQTYIKIKLETNQELLIQYYLQKEKQQGHYVSVHGQVPEVADERAQQLQVPALTNGEPALLLVCSNTTFFYLGMAFNIR